MVLSVRNPQEKKLPETIALNVPVGGDDCLTLLSPQQAMVLSVRNPQEKLAPEVIALNVPVVGAVDDPLLQQVIVPSSLRPQDRAKPVLTMLNVSSGGTSPT